MLDASRRGLQIRQPLPWLHLLYLHIGSGASAADSRVEGGFLGADSYVPAVRPQAAVLASAKADVILIDGRQVWTRPRDTVARWNRDVRLVLEYRTELGPLLRFDANGIQAALLAFARGVFEHAQRVAEGGSSGERAAPHPPLL
ncbi:MAG: hypothetical protein ACRC33_16080 [Gemmataceae bacterium]